MAKAVSVSTIAKELKHAGFYAPTPRQIRKLRCMSRVQREVWYVREGMRRIGRTIRKVSRQQP